MFPGTHENTSCLSISLLKPTLYLMVIEMSRVLRTRLLGIMDTVPTRDLILTLSPSLFTLKNSHVRPSFTIMCACAVLEIKAGSLSMLSVYCTTEPPAPR